MHEKEDIVALPNSKWQDYDENCHKLTSTPSVCWVQQAELLSQPLVHFFMISRNNYSSIVFIYEMEAITPET